VVLRRAAEDSIRAQHAGEIARDRRRAEASETSGDWETALVLWEVLQRADPGQPSYAGRAERARTEIGRGAQAAIVTESGRRLASTLAEMARQARARGDAEEAAGLLRGIPAAGGPGVCGRALSRRQGPGRAVARARSHEQRSP